MSKKRFKRKNKGLGVDMCCEICNNCAANDEGQYICDHKCVIEVYMPTDDYYWCNGEQFERRAQL